MNKKYLLFSLTLFLASCSNPLGRLDSFVDSDYGLNPTPFLSAPSGLEVISGASFSVTSSGRKVSISSGHAISQVRLSTTKNRIVYLNVQGQIND
jgi:hypothetical protein